MMTQAGAVGVVGVAVAAQMFLKVQTIATNKCYQPILFQTQGLHLCGPTVLYNQVSSVKPVRGGRRGEEGEGEGGGGRRGEGK